MNSLPQEEPQPEVRQLENSLFQQMLQVEQPMAPEQEIEDQAE